MKKIITASLVGTLLVTGTSTVVNAQTQSQSQQGNVQKQETITNDVKNDKRYQALSPQAKDSFKTLVEANNYNNTEQMELLNNTAQTKGMDKNGNTERGKIGITKKVVKQAWNSLPTKVKKKIGTQSKFYAALKALDHFTGDVEDEIYKQMKGLGLSDNYAWIATKAITLIIL